MTGLNQGRGFTRVGIGAIVAAAVNFVSFLADGPQALQNVSDWTGVDIPAIGSWWLSIGLGVVGAALLWRGHYSRSRFAQEAEHAQNGRARSALIGAYAEALQRFSQTVPLLSESAPLPPSEADLDEIVLLDLAHRYFSEVPDVSLDSFSRAQNWTLSSDSPAQRFLKRYVELRSLVHNIELAAGVPVEARYDASTDMHREAVHQLAATWGRDRIEHAMSMYEGVVADHPLALRKTEQDKERDIQKMRTLLNKYAPSSDVVG